MCSMLLSLLLSLLLLLRGVVLKGDFCVGSCYSTVQERDQKRWQRCMNRDREEGKVARNSTLEMCFNRKGVTPVFCLVVGTDLLQRFC